MAFTKTLKTGARYAIRSAELDKNWKGKILKVILLTDMEFKKDLDQAIIHGNIKTLYGSPFIRIWPTSWSFYSLLKIILFSCN